MTCLTLLTQSRTHRHSSAAEDPFRRAHREAAPAAKEEQVREEAWGAQKEAITEPVGAAAGVRLCCEQRWVSAGKPNAAGV